MDKAEIVKEMNFNQDEAEVFRRALRIQNELLKESVDRNLEIFEDYARLKDKISDINEKFEEKIKELKNLHEMRKKQEKRIENLINKISEMSNLIDYVRELKKRNEELEKRLKL
ncbi:MAG: hypothetical protein DRN95_04985 [Candidatus Hydrothermarchaeota archaeon]|nr:MAG: hypothetical protein DRN95_04985 [Candidatus Hydrothermarchaeota archaeon]